MKFSKLSIVVPAYNEEANIVPLLQRLRAVVETMKGMEAEFIIVDDHSRDGTSRVVMEEHRKDPRVKLLRLSRNSGSHTALQAGLCHTSGDAAVTMSADLQEPPEIIPEMLERIKAGKHIVWAVRASRSDSLINRARASLYHRFFKKFILPAYPKKGADHFMIAGEALKSIRSIPEKNTSLMGLVCWMGFEQDQVLFHRDKRLSGESKWSFPKTFKLIIDSLVSFSYLPVRAMSALGFLMAAFGFLYIVFLVGRYIFFDSRGVEGWHSLMIMLVLVSGIQMMMLGILGEYLWRIFEESRRRPLYIIENSIGFPKSPLDP